jgi:oligopeptide transport system substrate-binding protein
MSRHASIRQPRRLLLVRAPAAALVLALALLAHGCARERPADAARAAGILLLGNGPEPQALDFHLTTGASELAIQMALYEGLVAPHPATLEPLPAAAESWTRSEDGRVWRFAIRAAARWSDGAPVTAADFVAAWERALKPATGAPYAYMLHVLDGAEAFNRTGGGDFAAVGARALDDGRLEVRLARPVPHFLSLLLHPVWYPVPAHVLAEGPDARRDGVWTRPGSFVGNGPFVLAEWRVRQYVAAERNPLYWDSATVRLAGIRFAALDEPGAEERAFLAGQLHVTNALPPARVPAWRGDPALRIDPYLGTYYILPNARRGVLAEPRVRRALSLAVDRHALVDNLLGAGQRPAAVFVPDNMPGYRSPGGILHDPERARELLAEAGFPGGRGFPVLEYLFNSSESHRQIAEALQAMWRAELGVDIQLVNQEWRTYLQRRESGDFQLARAVWIGDYLEPSTFLDLWTSDSGNNWTGWASAAYDAHMEAAHSSADAARRMDAYRAAEAILLEQQAVIPLYHYVTVYLKDPALRGWEPNLLNWHPVKHLYFE